MAQRRRIENGVGMLPLPEVSEKMQEGRLAGIVAFLHGAVRDAIRHMNGRLSLGDGTQSTQSGNIDGQWIEWTFPSGANTEVEIPHGLGRRPAGYTVWRSDRACRVYDSNVSGWGNERFYVKCDTADAVVLLLVV